MLGRNLTFYNPSNIELGSDTYIAFGCWFCADAPIKLGDSVMFGPYCVVSSGNHTLDRGSYRHGSTTRMPIHVGHGTWVGAHAVLTAGTNIGRACLVAAGAVVNGEVPDGSAVGGVPARTLHTRAAAAAGTQPSPAAG